jgi:magnesium chelatase family protein
MGVFDIARQFLPARSGQAPSRLNTLTDPRDTTKMPAIEVAARVAAARDIQTARYAAAGLPQVRTNAEAPASVLETIAQPDAQGTKLLRDAAETMRLSARGYHRVLRVARTLADLDGAEKIGRLHLAEALSYRALADDLRRAA